ncbi:response regulator transcription factor [Nitrospira sp. KM1]|uniref:response regulator transcription factor n=1 Tax=Nitrospira sp. KM1 TaxID=1936990 RepID=UPI0015671E80|nr:response regulator transcription factor [Nitrospira sp. KM1]
MAATKGTILIITNSESSRSSLTRIFRECGYEVLAASNARTLETIQQDSLALVVADRQVCTVDKLRMHKALRTMPIISVGAQARTYSEDEYIDDLERGADLVLFNQTTRELVARVRAILRRKESSLHPIASCQAGGVQMDLDRHEVRVNGKLVKLTPKEFQILRCFLESPSRLFSRQDMLNCVWGEGYALEQHALDVHICSLRQKIEDNPAKPKLILTVRGIGYKLRSGV